MIHVATDMGAPTLAAALERAKQSERNGYWSEARTQYEVLLNDPHLQAPNLQGRAMLLRWIGRTYLEEGCPESALGIYTQARKTADRGDDPAGVAHATNCLAIVEQQMGNLDHSEDLYAEARGMAFELGDDGLVAMIDQNLGTIANIRGNLGHALRCYESSLKRYRALGMTDYQAFVLNNMGLLYTDLGEWTDAESAYAEAHAAYASVSDVGQQVRIAVNQIELWIARGAYDKARARCVSLISAASADKDSASWRGEVYKHYGVLCRESNEYAIADEYLKRAAQTAEETKDTLLAVETAREQAELYGRQQRNTDMLRMMNHAHKLLSQLRAARELSVLDRRNARLEEQFLQVARDWGESIEGKDRYTQGHCERVADLACILAERVGFDSKTLFWFRIGALLHDVGKLIVPMEVLNKPGRLNDDEWVIMRRHPEAGVELLVDIEFPWDVRPMIRNHHERWDGAGYPDKLAGENIPLSARILCIADVYDALTTTRPYRTAFSHAKTVDMMCEMEGQFDPTLFAIFLDWARGDTKTHGNTQMVAA